ncbi:tRNA (adenosine(37)-N6)-dimethylallyltransferase MiaA [candidate division KSB1 bacterium]
MSGKNRTVITIVGPTGVGKTEIGYLTALRLNGEIISADSRQMYRYMNIGTDKPPKQYRDTVRHHFVDFLDPLEKYTAGRFGKDARKVIDTLFKKNKTPIIVGGSGLYIKALLEGFFDEPMADDTVKEELKREITVKGNRELYNELRKVDPVFAEQITVNDSQRIIRGLEVFRASGKPLSRLWEESKITVDLLPLYIGLTKNRKKLYSIIDDRVESMIERGLIKEVKTIASMGYSKNLNALQTYGYQEVIEFLEGLCTFEEMVEKIKRRTRNFAKRQMTWFRKIKGIHWFTVRESSEEIVEGICNVYNAGIQD